LNDTFVKKSKIRDLIYIPHPLAMFNHLQAIIYVIYDQAHSKIKALAIKYDREILTLKDGGTLAIEWY
jgi:hypothetical protein